MSASKVARKGFMALALTFEAFKAIETDTFGLKAGDTDAASGLYMNNRCNACGTPDISEFYLADGEYPESGICRECHEGAKPTAERPGAPTGDLGLARAILDEDLDLSDTEIRDMAAALLIKAEAIAQ